VVLSRVLYTTGKGAEREKALSGDDFADA